MKDNIMYIAVIMAVTMMLLYTVDYERKIESLQDELNNKDILIDSLFHEMDTLTWEQEMWDYDISQNTTHLLSAIMFVESSYNDSAYVASEDAVGCLQIRKCMVKDVNRILRRQKSNLKFTYNDRWSRSKSIKMFDIYREHYGLITAEEIARCWNGGPKGMENEITAKYWKKVENQLDS
tara:strand:+ start:277 stop:813 length:537 start_codon:yes stop_codon:yes gene_type:complete